VTTANKQRNANENKPVNNSEKCKAYRRKYMIEYMKDRGADDKFRINENQKRVQGCNIKSKTSRNKKHQAAKRTKLNPEHVREIEQRSLRVLVLGSNTVITMVTLSAVIHIVIYSVRFVSLSAIACQ